MGSQLDLDQGGTFRQYQRIWMGPSVGWQTMPVQAILDRSTAGTLTLLRWTNLVKLKVPTGTLDIDLPSSKASAQGPQAIPGQWIYNPVIIMDLLGTAANPTVINVNPFGSELISGLAQIQLATPYGTILLEPDLVNGGWTLGQ
jgi:hypothetical protein